MTLWPCSCSSGSGIGLVFVLLREESFSLHLTVLHGTVQLILGLGRGKKYVLIICCMVLYTLYDFFLPLLLL